MIKEELLNRSLEDLGKRYPVGLYEFLFKHRPDLYKQLLELEDRIDQTYLNPKASIDQLKAVLRKYWRLHIQGIKEFKLAGRFDLPTARQEMEESRIKA